MRFLAIRAVLSVAIAIQVWTFAAAHADAQRRRRERPPESGTLVLQAAQQGAEVLVDEQSVGATPLAPLTLAPGPHTLRVRLPGYTEFTEVVRVEPGRPTEVAVDLLPLSQVLAVSSDPPGAHVYVDGDFMGDTPVEFDLIEGPHSIRIAQRGYEDVIREIDARAGSTGELAVALVALPSESRSDATDSTEWYEEPATWIAIGGGAVAIAVAIAVTLVVTSDSAESQVDSFCDRAGGCIRVETPW